MTTAAGDSEGAGRLPELALASPSWRRWRLFGVYLGLARCMGAISVDGHRLDVRAAAGRQQVAWGGLPKPDGAKHAHVRRGTQSGARRCAPSADAGPDCSHEESHGLSWQERFSLLLLAAPFVGFLVFHRYLSGWFPEEVALAGTLFVAASLPLTFTCQYWESATDPPEPIVFSLGIWCIRESRMGLLCLVTLVGWLNRETAVFLPVVQHRLGSES